MNNSIRLFPVTLLLLFLFSANKSYGQHDISPNTIYADFATKGATYSLNYDRIFSTGEKFNKSYRIGFTVLKNAIAMPSALIFLPGTMILILN